MTTKNKRGKLIVLVLPLLVLLGACKSAATVDVSDPDNPILVFEFDAKAAGLNDCSGMQSRLDDQKSTIGEGTVESLPNGSGCRIKIKLSSTFKVLVTKTRDTVKVNIPSEFWTAFSQQIKSNTPDLESLPLTFTIKFPNAVEEASNNGKISGNTVTWTGYSTIKNGISASSSISGSSSDDDSTKDHDESDSPEATATDDDKDSGKEDSEGGFPVWAWVAIGVGGVAVLGLLVFFAVRKKGGDNGQPGGGYPGPGGYFPPSANQPQGDPYAGMPAYGQPQGDPYAGAPTYGQPQGDPYAGAPAYEQPQPYAGTPGQVPFTPQGGGQYGAQPGGYPYDPTGQGGNASPYGG